MGKKKTVSPMTKEEFLAMHGLAENDEINSFSELTEFLGDGSNLGMVDSKNVERVRKTVHNLYQKAYSVTDKSKIAGLMKSIDDAISHYKYALNFDEADFSPVPGLKEEISSNLKNAIDTLQDAKGLLQRKFDLLESTARTPVTVQEQTLTLIQFLVTVPEDTRERTKDNVLAVLCRRFKGILNVSDAEIVGLIEDGERIPLKSRAADGPPGAAYNLNVLEITPTAVVLAQLLAGVFKKKNGESYTVRYFQDILGKVQYIDYVREKKLTKW